MRITSEYRAKTLDELGKEIKELKKHLFRLRMQKSIGQLDNAAQIKETRKKIARALTIIGEKKRDKDVI